MRGVAKIVRVRPARETRARGGFDGDDLDFSAAAKLRADEWKRDAGEVRSTADAPDDHVRVLLGHLDLQQRLSPITVW